QLANLIEVIARGQPRDNRLGFIRIHAVRRQKCRRVLLPNRAAEFKAVAAVLFCPSEWCEGIAGVQGFVAEAEVEATVPTVQAGFGEDIYADERRFVIFSGVGIGAESNLANLAFRRKLAA